MKRIKKAIKIATNIFSVAFGKFLEIALYALSAVLGPLFERIEQMSKVTKERITKPVSFVLEIAALLIWISFPEGLWQTLIAGPTTLSFGAWRFSLVERKNVVKFMALFSAIYFFYVFLVVILLQKNPTKSQLVVGSIYGTYKFWAIFYEKK